MSIVIVIAIIHIFLAGSYCFTVVNHITVIKTNVFVESAFDNTALFWKGLGVPMS